LPGAAGVGGRAGGSPRRRHHAVARARAANVRLFHLAAEILHAIELGVFGPNPGWQ